MRGPAKPVFVKLNSADSGDGLDAVYLTHPDDLVVEARLPPWTTMGWGIPIHRDTDGTIEAMMKRVTRQNLYLGGQQKPEEQFTARLRSNWLKQNETFVAGERKNLKGCDYVLRVDLHGGHQGTAGRKMHYRRIKVSGGLSLRVLADKVLLPLMGFIRNFHSHVFLANCQAGAWATVGRESFH